MSLRRLFRDLSFKSKLTFVMTLASAMTLGLASVVLLSVELGRRHGDMREDVKSLVEVVGASSVGALTFADPDAAAENLASLSRKAPVVSARLYGVDGRPLATYQRRAEDAHPAPAVPGSDGFRVEDGHLLVFSKVRQGGEVVGTIFIKADLAEARSRVAGYALSVLAVMLVSVAAAFLLSSRLQGIVSRPILRLTSAARAVSESQDYSIRVSPAGGDELGLLTRAFNGMLSRIQEQNDALCAARDQLETRVEERVQDLRREMHERALAELALHESEARYRSIVESTHEWIWSMDPAGKLTYSSAAAQRILGRTPDELVGVGLAELAHPDDRPKVEARIRDAQGPPGWVNLSLRLRHADGGYRTVETTATAQLDAERRPAGYHGLGRDTTERLLLEEQFRQAQKMEAVGRLAGGVAHDFNNLLGVILGYAQLLQRAPNGGGPKVDQIRRAAERAAALTRQLLAFSRKQVLEPRVLDLNAVITDLGKMLPRLIGEDIELVIQTATDLGRVKADPGQLEQVLMNLAVNARDAMSEGGTLRIETADVEVTHDEGTAAASGRYVRLTVSDTGCGMDQTTKSHIFEPFFTTKEQGKGTGLGLATVYGVVQQSGGFIRVESEPGRGTTFLIDLPRVDETPAGAPEQRSESLLGAETVLLVEDEDSLRQLTRELLESHGYMVVAAANGAEALSRAQTHHGPIDLLLTDVVMPGMSGRELAERLGRVRQETRTLFMSGYTDDAIIRHGVLAHESLLIQKPFSSEILARRVRQALDAPAGGVDSTSGPAGGAAVATTESDGTRRAATE